MRQLHSRFAPFAMALAMSCAASAQTPAGWTQQFIASGDVRLETFHKGKGPAVLMHPSLGRPAQDFEALGNRVVDAGFRVVLINPRGIGESTGPMDKATLRDLGADIWMVADRLGIDRAFVLGQNFGNRVARTASSLKPNRVIGLMLLAAGGEIEPSKEVWQEFARVFDPSLPAQRHLEAVANSFFAPGNDASVWKDGWYDKAARLQTEAAKQTDFSQIHFGGTAPMLVIQGLDDKIAPPENGWRLATRRPNARLVAIENMGHAMLPEQPDAVADAVIDFITQERGAGYGEDLYRMVKAYSDLGIHRVGTPVDAKTNAWFSEELERRGGKVARQPFKFDRFDGESTVTIDGQSVPSMPLYYEGVGDVESDKPYVAAVNAMNADRNSDALLNAIKQAKASGAKVAVIATENPSGELQTPNRIPKVASGLPVVLVPGEVASRLKSGVVRVKYSARLAPGSSDNIIATFGGSARPQSKPIVIATPLTGWFTCAAERATGVAVALGLAQRLAANYPVVVVGSPAHELLHHIGLEAFLKQNKLDPALVIHLGANVALGVRDAKTGAVKLAPGVIKPDPSASAIRSLFVRMDPAAFGQIKPVLAKADLPAVLNPPQWNGEGELWANASNAPLMSFTGIGSLFHTPSDIPENVTSPAALETVFSAIAEAVETFMGQTRQ